MEHIEKRAQWNGGDGLMVSNRKLAELFVGGARTGMGSHMYIDEDTIFSYGSHFPIARRVGANVYEFNEAKYSRTTSKHQGYVRGAIASRGGNLKKMRLYT